MRTLMEKAVSQIAERTSDRTRNERQNQLQRRNQVVDVYGMEFSRQGDTKHPATFYISVSPDLVYYERFEFKIIIQPFAMPVGDGMTGETTVGINRTSLSMGINNDINPNPHDHTTQKHNHPLNSGITLFSSTISDFQVFIEEIDMTPYLKAQGKGWPDREGVFPKEQTANYDVLEAADSMPDWQQGVILQPGYKKVELKANGIFNATLVSYLKYSHVNR